MHVNGTYFQNDLNSPICYGKVDIHNIPRQRLKGEPLKDGILANTVIAGFCGTDYELMRMSENQNIHHKFPLGENRLINGHEGVVWIPEQKRFAIVLIRGGDAYDPTRYQDDETYFEYGCDKADGIMCEKNYYHPDMLLPLPKPYTNSDQLPISIAKRLVFADPYACMLFQYERMKDLGSAHLFRVMMSEYKCGEQEGRILAEKKVFQKVVIFGLGATGLFIGDIIQRNHPEAEIIYIARSAPDSFKVKYTMEQTKGKYIQNLYSDMGLLADKLLKEMNGRATLFIGASGTQIEHELAFNHEVLGNNGIYNSFSLGPKLQLETMPFGFKNHLLFGSINFRQTHMEQAINILCNSSYDEIVELIDLNQLKENPVRAYKEVIYAKDAPLKTAVIWNKEYIDTMVD